jgi:hypothetical protein
MAFALAFADLALAFVGLDSWSEHGTLMVAKREMAGKRELEAVVDMGMKADVKPNFRTPPA